MGHKKVCFTCRKAFSVNLIEDRPIKQVCPECGLKTIPVNHKFKPPKQGDARNWVLAKFMVDNGFYYDHVSDNGRDVQYPTTIEEAKLFVIKYKSQAYFYTEKETGYSAG